MDRLNLSKTLNGISLVLVILFLIFDKKWLLFLSALFLLVSIFGGRYSYAMAELWMKLGQFLGTVITKIFLTFVFYFLVTPLAFLFRIFNREIYLFFKDKRRDSFFKDINIEYKKDDFEKLW